jgi:hypothetical protein
MTYVTILQPATLPFWVDKLRQNNVLSNPLQAWQSYCDKNNTTLVPKSEFKLNGWVKDTRKEY